MTDWGAHHIDIAQWALDADGSGPVEVECVSRTEPEAGEHSYNTHPNFEVKCTYAGGVPVHVMSDGENGVHFEGEDGWLFVSRGDLKASDEKLIKEPLGADAQRLEVATDHAQNFVDGVHSRQQPICGPVVGGGSVIVCHIAAIACRLNNKFTWDPKAHTSDNDEVNAMLTRERREPWVLPTL
jgi:predicted dehydrogenase